MEKKQPTEGGSNLPFEANLPLAVSEETTTALSYSKPSWFTPRRLLYIFCVINLLNYADRGAIASNGVNGMRQTCKGGKCSSGSGIQGDFDLTNFEDGALSSAFMVGLLVASPIFASLTKSVNPFRLIGVGLSVWTFATAGCGFSVDFWSITFCRMLVGVGEASFISLAAPFIDDNAPAAQPYLPWIFLAIEGRCFRDGAVYLKQAEEVDTHLLFHYRKTAWLATFYMCIPSGIALGYVYGGLVGRYLSWRVAFLGEAVLMLPFAVLGFIMKPLQLKGFSRARSEKASIYVETAASKSKVSNGTGDTSTEKEFVDQSLNKRSKSKGAFSRFLKDMKVLSLEKVYVVNILGYISYNFVIGAYSYWGPKAGHSIYHMHNADMIFGAVTIACGILGTLMGGYVLDFMTSTISNAFKLLSVTTCVGAAFCFGAFCLRSLYGFLALFSIGELLVFATQGPVNYICLHCVKPSMRPLSMAMSTVFIHIFGDVPSSPLVGVLQDRVDDWRQTALILTSVLFLAAATWCIGIFLNGVDRSDEESEDSDAEDDMSIKSTSLPEEKTAGTR